MINFENFLPIYSEIRKAKDVGQIEDLLEGLKVYDKNENGTMMAAELAHVLLSLGKDKCILVTHRYYLSYVLKEL